MAISFLATLHGVGFTLPDGSLLFQDIDESIGAETVAVIGRNGSGKSTFGRIVSGALEPGRGRVERAGPVHHVAQQAGPVRARHLAELAGVYEPLAALCRLLDGSGSGADVELIGERWDLQARWQALLERAGLDETRDPALLSGGERTLLALIGGFCSDAGLLVLDEPSNHLDRERRAWLFEEIARWRAAGRGLLLITHDRELLEHADRTLELRPPGVYRYGGGWSTVTRQRDAELAAWQTRLERARVERRRAELEMRRQAERSERKLSRGKRERGTGSQCKLMLDAIRDRADRSGGALAERHAQRRGQLQQDVSDAFASLGDAAARPAFPELGLAIPNGQETLVLDGLVQSFAWSRPFDWSARGPVRVALRGPNGCGKSSLLRVLAGQAVATSGSCRTPLHAALLDQSLALLEREESLLDQLQAASPSCPEGRLRQYLALAGIGGPQVHRPSALLSGGEQMRGALLCAVLSEPRPGMLLLDEPTNHLDLAATEALEAMLRGWPGVLVVVSHDDAFLRQLRLTHVAERDGDGWRVRETG